MKVTKRILVIPDTHTPFHDPKAVAIMKDVAKDFKPNEVVYIGDWFDCYCVSNYDKDPMVNFGLLDDELKEGREIIDEVERATKAQHYVFLAGNHEQRVDRYISTYASKLAGNLDTKSIFKIPDRYQYIPYGQGGYYKAGKLLITHGNLTGQNPASAMVKKYRANVMFGHTHKIQEYQITDIYGAAYRGINIGWLGNIKRAAEYIKDSADWAHGFALVYVLSNGDFFTQIVHIVNYRAIVSGRLYK